MVVHQVSFSGRKMVPLYVFLLSQNQMNMATEQKHHFYYGRMYENHEDSLTCVVQRHPNPQHFLNLESFLAESFQVNMIRITA